MECHVCRSDMQSMITDFPFKVREHSIVIIKNLPVMQCGNCREYLIEDSVMERVDAILEKTEAGAELKIVRFAA